MCLRLSSKCPQSFVKIPYFHGNYGSAWICDETLSLVCVIFSNE